MAKRIVDVLFSSLGLLLLSPLLVVVAILIKVDSPGPVLFRQLRIGLGFRPFIIYKFRTMFDQPSYGDMQLASDTDPRITRLGKTLRRTKIDELPQLINILKGEMSFVGPRPEVGKYVELFRNEYGEILRVKPGITDLASLKYCDEATVLGMAENPEETYVKRILPEKVRLAKEYLKRCSLTFDLILVFKTLLKLFGYKANS